MSIVECYQAYHTYIMRASEITDILNAVTHGAVNRQMMAAPTLFVFLYGAFATIIDFLKYLKFIKLVRVVLKW